MTENQSQRVQDLIDEWRKLDERRSEIKAELAVLLEVHEVAYEQPAAPVSQAPRRMRKVAAEVKGELAISIVTALLKTEGRASLAEIGAAVSTEDEDPSAARKRVSNSLQYLKSRYDPPLVAAVPGRKGVWELTDAGKNARFVSQKALRR